MCNEAVVEAEARRTDLVNVRRAMVRVTDNMILIVGEKLLADERLSGRNYNDVGNKQETTGLNVLGFHNCVMPLL